MADDKQTRSDRTDRRLEEGKAWSQPTVAPQASARPSGPPPPPAPPPAESRDS
jgi:hypothetical protein